MLKHLSYRHDQAVINDALVGSRDLQAISQTALDIMSRWPDEKYDRMIGYMRRNMDPRDVTYMENNRRIRREHGDTFPRQAAFTLVHR